MKNVYLLILLMLSSLAAKCSTLALSKFVIESQYLQNGKILLPLYSNTIKFDVSVTRGYVNGSLEAPISFNVKLVYRQSGKSDVDLCPFQTITETDFNGATASKTYSAVITSDKSVGSVYLVYTYYDYVNSITIGPISSYTSYLTYNPNIVTPPTGDLPNKIVFGNNLKNYINFQLINAGGVTTSSTVGWEYATDPSFTNIRNVPVSPFDQFDNTELYAYINLIAKSNLLNPHAFAVPVESATIYIRRRVSPIAGVNTYSNVIQITPPSVTGVDFNIINLTNQLKKQNPNYHHPLGDNYVDISIDNVKPNVSYNILQITRLQILQGTNYRNIDTVKSVSGVINAVASSTQVILTLNKNVFNDNLSSVVKVYTSEGYSREQPLTTVFLNQ